MTVSIDYVTLSSFEFGLAAGLLVQWQKSCCRDVSPDRTTVGPNSNKLNCESCILEVQSVSRAWGSFC